MLEGFLSVLSVDYVAYMFIGVFAGIAVGALPGFTATMGIALVLPFAVAQEPGVALGMLAALYIASNFADAVPACLVNTPGTPAAMATAFDGFQMTRQGRGQEALVAAGFSALAGSLVGGLTFMFVTPPLADVALRFGPPEFFWLGIFALTIIGSVAGDSLLKGLAGGCIGLIISTIGLSPTGEVSRFTFDFRALRGGIELVGALIGIFALPQILEMVNERRSNPTVAEFTRRRGIALRTIRDIVMNPLNVIRSSVIGTLIGILPGAGGPVASLVAYSEAVRWSRDPTKFGKGTPDGVVASEAAGNAAAGGAMVPLMALGVPGSGPSAVILGALLLLGLRPGPLLFSSQPTLVYGLAWSIILAGFVTFIIGGLMSGVLARMVRIPVRFLAPLVLFLSMMGAFAIRNVLLDVTFMVVLGVAVYFLARLGFHPGPIGLGVVLGPIVEPALVQSLAIANASSIPQVFFARPVSIIIIIASLASAAWAVWSNWRHRRAARAALGEVEIEPVRLGVSVNLVAGLVLVGIGGIFLSASGRGLQDWLFPIALAVTMGVIGIGLVVRGLLVPGEKLSLIPALLRGRGVDVAVFLALTAVYLLLIEPVGFWVVSALAIFGMSIYLALERTLRAIVASALVGIAAVLVANYVMLQVFYVPLPRSRWLPFL